MKDSMERGSHHQLATCITDHESSLTDTLMTISSFLGQMMVIVLF